MSRKSVFTMRWVVVLLCVIGGVFVASCAFFAYKGPIIALPSIPGATYVGMADCATCHTKQAAEFRGAPHAAFSVEVGDSSGRGIASDRQQRLIMRPADVPQKNPLIRGRLLAQRYGLGDHGLILRDARSVVT